MLDIRKNERSAEIKGLSEPQGVFYSSQNDRLYVASGGDGTLRIYDGSTLKLRQALEFGADADNVRYDGHSGQILVGFGSGGLGLVDASGQKTFRWLPSACSARGSQYGFRTGRRQNAGRGRYR